MEQASASQSSAARSKRFRAVLYAALACAGVAAAAGAGWWRWIHAVPAIPRSAPRLPSPNAWSYYVEASTLVAEPEAVGKALGPPLPADAERERLVRLNAPALAKLREGMGHSCMAPPPDGSAGHLEEYRAFRQLARLLRLEGQARAARGDWSGALASTLDCLQLGVDTERGGPLIGMLVSVAIRAIGRRDAPDYVERLTAAEARSAARRLEEILSREVALAEVMTAEREFGRLALTELFHRPHWRRGYYREISGMTLPGAATPSGPDWEEIWMTLQLYTLSNHRIARNYEVLMEQVIQEARLPHGAPAPPLPPADPVSESNAGLSTGSVVLRRADGARDGLLLAGLALRAYRVENGRYPASLEALAPAYLKRIPLDPFARDAALKYRSQGESYVLYSVGPDGKDDGGRAIGSGARNSPSRMQVTPGSLGDMVYGINR